MLPDIPLEIWHRILELTCTDDLRCITSHALSLTSRELWHISRYHRYHSVTIRGWKDLLAFEEEFGSYPRLAERNGGRANVGMAPSGDDDGGHGGITHLHIELEELWSVAYPDEDGDQEAGSDTSDRTYLDTASFSSEELVDNEDVDAEMDIDDERETSSDSSSLRLGERERAEERMEERTLEHSQLSDFELEELGSELALLSKQGQIGFFSDPRVHHICDLEGERSTALTSVECQVYSALRRLLEVCAVTIKTLKISWKPFTTFSPTAVIPLLPRLRILCWESDKEGCHQFSPTTYPKETMVPSLLPSLQHLDIKVEGDTRMAEGLLLLCPGVRVVSAPQRLLQKICLPTQTKEVRVYVEQTWGGSLGQLNLHEIRTLYSSFVRNRSPSAKYYAVARTKAQLLRLLSAKLLRVAQDMDGSHDDDPRLQHSTDVCLELLRSFGVINELH